MISKTRDSFARMSSRSLIVSISCLVFALIFSRFEAGELIEAQIENLVRLVFAESVAAIDQAGFVADQDADLLDLLPGELEGEQFHPRLVAIG